MRASMRPEVGCHRALSFGSLCAHRSGVEIRCQSIILARKDEPTPNYAQRQRAHSGTCRQGLAGTRGPRARREQPVVSLARSGVAAQTGQRDIDPARVAESCSQRRHRGRCADAPSWCMIGWPVLAVTRRLDAGVWGPGVWGPGVWGPGVWGSRRVGSDRVSS